MQQYLQQALRHMALSELCAERSAWTLLRVSNACDFGILEMTTLCCLLLQLPKIFFHGLWHILSVLCASSLQTTSLVIGKMLATSNLAVELKQRCRAELGANMSMRELSTGSPSA